jgi:sigma-E factor negative regulatory protein RseB
MTRLWHVVVTGVRPRWVVALTLGLLVSPALAGSSEAARSGVVPGSDPAAVALLGQAAQAETAVAYEGTQEVLDLDALPGLAQQVQDEQVEVAHAADQGTILVQRGSGGQVRAGYADVSTRRSALLLPLLQGSYRLAVGGREVVAGRASRVVEALRPDGTTAARFFVDAGTGLLLRRDLVDRAGATVASVAFREVRVDDAYSPASVDYLPPLLPTVTGGSLDEASLDGWRGRGWPCAPRLGDMTLYDARPADDGSGALHLAYSDGLSTASVFVQQGSLDAAGLGAVQRTVVAGQPVLVRDGHPRTLFWSADGYVITVVSDAPAADLTALVADLPRPQAPPTGWARLGHGLARVVSWVNPFD